MYSVFDELLGMPAMVYVPWDMWDSNVHCVDDNLLLLRRCSVDSNPGIEGSNPTGGVTF